MGSFTRFLNTLPAGPKGNVGDFRHAARIFVDGTYRLSPRHKFLYYVYFEIDPSLHQSAQFTALKADREMSFLVKRADLPKATFDSVTKNQYNRKRIVYKQLNFDPVNISFHDDNSGIMHSLYSLYYGYYARDALNREYDYSLGNSYAETGARYNMDIDVTENLFKRISIFTLSRSRFNEYRLISPRIKNWSHGDVDYATNGEPIESQMTIEYEAFTYDVGTVSVGSPDGWAELAYDKVESPLTLGGGGLRGIAGALGLDIYNDITSTFGAITGKNIAERPGSFILSALGAVNSYKRFNPGAQAGVSGTLGALRSPGAVAGAVGLVAGAVFPRDSTGLGALAATLAAPKIINSISSSNTNSFGSTFGGTGGKPPTASKPPPFTI